MLVVACGQVVLLVNAEIRYDYRCVCVCIAVACGIYMSGRVAGRRRVNIGRYWHVEFTSQVLLLMDTEIRCDYRCCVHVCV